MKLILAALGLGLVATAALWPFAMARERDSQEKKPKRPVDVFAELDGKWRGTFVVYDASGKELHRIAVEQEYRTVDANTQTVRIRDRMTDGKVITGKGTNTARRGADGKLVLKCSVEKSDGERSDHHGRIVKGPGGGKQLVWFSDSKNRTETFREWVDTRGGRTTYHIHGLGRYGESLLLMGGDYTKIAK